ncbi:hypothetical protein CFOL_v3_35093, partial [Cephalotus follicularis]
MCSTEANCMASVMSSLSHSFHHVTPTAVPSMLDCILSSTALPPSSLFASLLDRFPVINKDIVKHGEKLDSDQCNNLVSMVGALCHLLKKLETTNDALQSFMWKIFIPLQKMAQSFDREMLNQIAESFFDVVTRTNTWGVLEETLVPYFLRSVGLSVGMLQNDDSDIIQWSSCSVLQGTNHLINDTHKDTAYMLSLSETFPLPMSCHMLTSILDAALLSLQVAPTTDSILTYGCSHVGKFAANLLSDLCNMTERLLSQSLEHRSCTIGFLLPIIFKAFLFHCSLEILFPGEKLVITRNSFLVKIWKCCRTLFSLGPLERRDAYTVLSLYVSFLSRGKKCQNADMKDKAEEFDLSAEKEFWDEIKRGLVDKEGLVRKQSLHILKTVLDICGETQCYPGISEEKLSEKQKKSHEKFSVPHGMTKRELWAHKEAKSLGIGELFHSVDTCLNSQKQWEAFFLLYEMLEEYGTHLVEAAWNHQVALLLRFSFSYDGFARCISRVHQNQIDPLGEIFNWLSILWVRGFHHDNPQVRCMIMQSFLGIHWSSYGHS